MDRREMSKLLLYVKKETWYHVFRLQLENICFMISILMDYTQ